MKVKVPPLNLAVLNSNEKVPAKYQVAYNKKKNSNAHDVSGVKSADDSIDDYSSEEQD